MDKCFCHWNGCYGKWEIYIGQRQPVCGMGGFLKDSDGETLKWDSIGDALEHAARNNLIPAVEIVGR